MWGMRNKILVVLGCVLLAVGAAYGATQQSKPAPTPDIETTVVARFEDKRSEDASQEAKAQAMVEPTAQAMPTVTPVWGRL